MIEYPNILSEIRPVPQLNDLPITIPLNKFKISENEENLEEIEEPSAFT